MEPSTSSASSGLFFGITSASTDVRSGGGAAKPFRFFRCTAQDADGFLDPPGKNRFPLPEGVNVDALPPPAPDVPLCPLEDARVLPQFFRDGPVHGQAAPVDLPVAGALRPVRRSRGGPRFPSRQVEKFLFPLVEVAGKRLLDIMGLAPAGLPGQPRKPRFPFRAQANGEHGAAPM